MISIPFVLYFCTLSLNISIAIKILQLNIIIIVLQWFCRIDILRKLFKAKFLLVLLDRLTANNIDANNKIIPPKICLALILLVLEKPVMWKIDCVTSSFFLQPLYCQFSLSRNYSYRSKSSKSNRRRFIIISITTSTVHYLSSSSFSLSFTSHSLIPRQIWNSLRYRKFIILVLCV